jgi:hypothetical protein
MNARGISSKTGSIAAEHNHKFNLTPKPERLNQRHGVQDRPSVDGPGKNGNAFVPHIWKGDQTHA